METSRNGTGGEAAWRGLVRPGRTTTTRTHTHPHLQETTERPPRASDAPVRRLREGADAYEGGRHDDERLGGRQAARGEHDERRRDQSRSHAGPGSDQTRATTSGGGDHCPRHGDEVTGEGRERPSAQGDRLRLTYKGLDGGRAVHTSSGGGAGRAAVRGAKHPGRATPLKAKAGR
jgi:hypothetical protein